MFPDHVRRWETASIDDSPIIYYAFGVSNRNRTEPIVGKVGSHFIDQHGRYIRDFDGHPYGPWNNYLQENQLYYERELNCFVDRQAVLGPECERFAELSFVYPESEGTHVFIEFYRAWSIWGVMDTEGSILLDPLELYNRGIRSLLPFVNGMAPASAEIDGVPYRGFLTREGEFVGAVRDFDYVSGWSIFHAFDPLFNFGEDGIARTFEPTDPSALRPEILYGYVNLDGQIIVPPQYKYATAFRDGYGWTEGGFYNTSGQIVFADLPNHTNINRETGFADVVIDAIYGFHEGLARIARLVDQNGETTVEYAFINTDGDVVIPFRSYGGPQSYVVGFGEDRAFFASENSTEVPWGIIDTKGNVVSEPRFWFANIRFPYAGLSLSPAGQPDTRLPKFLPGGLVFVHEIRNWDGVTPHSEIERPIRYRSGYINTEAEWVWYKDWWSR